MTSKRHYLTREEEIVAIRAAQAGCHESLARVVDSQMDWMWTLAFRWENATRLEIDDCISVCQESLMKSTMKFDEKRNARLSNFFHEVTRRGIFAKLRQLKNFSQAIIKLSKSQELFDRKPDHRTPSPEDVAIQRETVDLVQAAIDQLPERDQEFVRRRMTGETFVSIAKSHGLVRASGHIAHIKALRKLRDILDPPESG